MKVLLVNGSPHKEGNTFIALKEVAVQLKAQEIESEILWIGNQPATDTPEREDYTPMNFIR
jgi:multimeric flavodoxin WrbA